MRWNVDKQLQQRLLGAAIIVALTVIFVPELVKRSPPVPAPTPPQTPAEQTTTIALDNPPATAQPAAQSAAAPMPPAQPAKAAPEPLPAASASTAQAPAPTDTSEQTSAAQPRPPSMPDQRQPVPHRAEPVSAQSHPAESHRSEAAQATTPRAPVQHPDTARRTTTSTAAASQHATAPPALPKIRMIAEPMSEYEQQLAKRRLAQAQSSQTQVQQPHWMVQVGSFADIKHAEQLRDKLQAEHFAAMLTPIRVDGHILYRVRIGPHSTRAAGERTRERLQREAGLNGDLIPVYN